MAAGSRDHPAWYGSVMGTGALALAFAGQAATWNAEWLSVIAFLLLIAASALAILLLPRYLRRLGNRATLLTEIDNPAHGPMLATLPAGLLVLAVAWGRIGPSFMPSSVALWINGVLLVFGVLIALALGLAWSSSMMHSSRGLESVNGGWLIPPVMNLLVPLGLSPLIVANPDAAPLLVLIGFAFFGVGTFLFLAIVALLIARLALREPLPAAMAASLWIPLAPAGVIGLSLIRLLQAATEAGVPGFSGFTAGLVVAAMGVGFGLWWAGFAGLELRRMRQNGGVPIHPGWWGFVFPIGAMTLSITAIGSSSGVLAIQAFGLVSTIALAVLWSVVAVRTGRLLFASGD